MISVVIFIGHDNDWCITCIIVYCCPSVKLNVSWSACMNDSRKIIWPVYSYLVECFGWLIWVVIFYALKFYPCPSVCLSICLSVCFFISFHLLTLVCLNQMLWNSYTMLVTTKHRSSLKFGGVSITILEVCPLTHENIAEVFVFIL